MSRFNLIDEKWIPVMYADGRRAELGIKETLLSATKITAIEDSSPLVVASLHRFLLAILYRALEGPTDIGQAKELFKTGLPAEKITAYLEKWRERFWLFHDKYPFYQVPDYSPKVKNGVKQWRCWSALAAEHNADNAKVLFDHTGVMNAGAIPLENAARWLLACQTFALGGGNSDFQYTKSAPSATAIMVMPLGVTLKDTLIFSLVPENREILKADKPIWERAPESTAALKEGPQRYIDGFSDLYSWRTRSVRFNFASDVKSIDQLAFASGIASSSDDFIDPMLSYRIDEKRGRLPLQFRERGLWRDFDSLLPDEADLSPRVVNNAIALALNSVERFPRAVLAIGQANNKAKIEYWRMELFALPQALAGKYPVRTAIRKLLVLAEETQKSLWIACRSYARDLLSRGGREPASEDVSNLVRRMPAIKCYWSLLEVRFHEILRDYTLERDFEDTRCQWLKYVRETLGATWARHCASVSTGDAWTIRALIKAELPVLKKIKELEDEILKLGGKEAI